ncbi:MAG: deoxyribodipyrimidine photo-lyase [Pseudomonadota bacterium]|nr:deoxyribodipyrimidine photo-lyase [Pseudomonadota bacterium]
MTERHHDEPAIVWFRNDLRVADNPALAKAAQRDGPVIPLYVFEEGDEAPRRPGAAQKWFQHHALAGLASRLASLGSTLVVRKGEAGAILDALIAETGARNVFWNRRHEPAGVATDRAIKTSLEKRGISVTSCQANLLHEPSTFLTTSKGPYRVYTPFWNALERQGEPRAPLPAPNKVRPHTSALASEAIDDLGLLPGKPDWSGGLRETWQADEDGAAERMSAFLPHGMDGYAEGRDRPTADHVSCLSPYLRWGVVSPFQLWHAARHAGAPEHDAQKFLKELAWREFCHHLAFHFPGLAWQNFNERFDEFPWRGNSEHLGAWKRGMTGYPLVDAGMRELWRTGYMHNRVRMVVASFLVKHLMVHWRVGEAWFWDTLVDGDPASNPANWQWVAGSGADAAPFFRIFNPVAQGTRFDRNGAYVRKWVPEIAALPDRYLHAPWQAPAETLAEHGIELGKTYPAPVVEHTGARERALAAFSEMGKHG